MGTGKTFCIVIVLSMMDAHSLSYNNICVRFVVQAVLTSDRCTNPVYVSVGHKVSLKTATSLVLECSRSRVPEPVRVVCYHIWNDVMLYHIFYYSSKFLWSICDFRGSQKSYSRKFLHSMLGL